MRRASSSVNRHMQQTYSTDMLDKRMLNKHMQQTQVVIQANERQP
jgi:hypothetical protein